MAKEKKYYAMLHEWAKRHGYYYEDKWQNIGDTKYRLDVVAIKNISIGHQEDELEVIGFEVKNKLDAKSISQAFNYFDYADKVYVVQVANSDYPKTLLEKCLTLKIGLLVRQGGKFHEVVKAPSVPHKNEAARIRFLEHRLFVYNCVLCGKHFSRKDEPSYPVKSVRNYLPKNMSKKGSIVTRRMCESCRCEVIRMSTSDLQIKVNKLEKDVSRLKRKMLCQKK